MASHSVREELNCSICLDTYMNPVTLRCGHNFCRGCINEVLDAQEGSGVYTCPQCRKRFTSRPSTQVNTNLNNIAERFHTTQPDTGTNGVFCTYCDPPFQAVKTCLQCEISMCEGHLRAHNKDVQHKLIDPIKKCPIHKKILGYYCTEDSAFICATCVLTQGHQDHQVQPVNEALEKKKEELRNLLEKVNSKTEETEKSIQNLQKDVLKLQGKADDVIKRINGLFREIRRQLDILERSLTSDVLLKKGQSLRSHTDLIKELEKQKEELLASKCRIEDLCHMSDPFCVLQEQQPDADVLRDIRSCVQSCSSGEVDVGLISRILQTRLAHITSGVNVWFYMQEPTDLLLDVTTAANDVQVSGDQRTAIYTNVNLNFQETPQRFQHIQVLSTRSFSSGRHYWDVETSATGNWRIGVCYPSMDRSGDMSNIGHNKVSWCLRRCLNGFAVRHNAECLTLPHVTSVNNIRVFLDYEAGQLSFYELGDPIRHLYTFTTTFTEPLHAAFMVYESWVRMKKKIGNRPDRT